MFKQLLTRLFAEAGIEVNGNLASDPRVLDEQFYRTVLLSGSVGLGDSYLHGWWECEDIPTFISRIVSSGVHLQIPRIDVFLRKLRLSIMDGQSRTQSKQVVKAHYNDDTKLFDLMLGSTNNYTCARWKGVTTLDEAQNLKMDLLCRKAELAEDKTVLDIGCGWGGFLSFAASQYKSTGIGLSISPVQVAYARKRYQGLPIEFRLQDYRDFFGKVDSVVSICMIEHVGPAHYREYFQKAYSSLSSTSGVFAMQCIIARDKRATMDPWTEKHIFPNGVLPTLRDLEKGVEGLFHIIDQEFFRDDYVKTFAAWRANLTRHRKEIVELYGEHYYRKYDYYLALYVAGFGTGRIDVGQFVLTPVQRLQYVPIRL